MVVPSSQKFKPSEKVSHKIYQVPYKPGFVEYTTIQPILEGNNIQSMFAMAEVLSITCESALSSTEIHKELKGFDLLIYDSLAFCGVLLGEHLDIPRVEILTNPSHPVTCNHIMPMPVSYVPQQFTGFSDKMTFVERAKNLGMYVGIKLFVHFALNRPMDALKLKYNITPERSFQEAAGDVELVIFRADFAIEYAQPLLPGMLSSIEGRI